MRTFSFTAKNIGKERYLTYTMGEGCELDEDILDVCEDGEIAQLLDIIYEEDEDFDYLTYDVTGKMTLASYAEGIMNKEHVFRILRNVASGLIECKEQAIPLAYILLNKNFMFINPDSLDIEFMCLPVESEGSVSAEFKGFVRQLIANLKFNVDEDLGYVGQLLTYINGDGFNLRGLIGLTEALMQDSGIGFDASTDIETEGGDVVSAVDEEAVAEAEKAGVSGFMNELDDAEGNLPEIGDDDVDIDLDLDVEIPGTEGSKAEEAASDHLELQKSVKVNKAALVQAAAEGVAAEEETVAEEISSSSKNAEENNNVSTESIEDAANNAKESAAKAESSANSMIGNAGVIKINPYIIRETTEEKTIISKPVFKIGKANRGVDYRIEGNGAISRQHAVIQRKGDAYYIKDNGSTNHTYVNGKELAPDEEVMLTNNCTITLGDEDFTFKLR